MHYGQESTNIRCELCQDGTDCQILSDTRAEEGGGGDQHSHASLNGVMSLWALVVWHVRILLSNEVQVDMVSRDRPAHSLWNGRKICAEGAQMP